MYSQEGEQDVDSPAYWWVTQNDNYEVERDLGCVFAPRVAADDKQRPFYARVMELQVGDVLFHSYHGEVKAVGRVRGKPYQTHRPYDNPPDYPSTQEGYYASIEYQELRKPIRVDRIPDALRHLPNSPFGTDGILKRQYLNPVPDELVVYLREVCRKRLPDLFPGPKVSW